MDGRRINFFKKRPNSHKRKAASKRGKWNNLIHEQSSDNSQTLDTVYRILCPSRKIGGVIGKGGSIVKALREETQAKITVSDSVPGSDERVIIIYSSPNKISSKQNNDEDPVEDNEEERQEPMQLHCAAQEALLKVHDRIVEEDLFGGMAFDDDNDCSAITVRLLVPNNTVGCVLGKGGDVIQRLRSETGASIRVLPAEYLPACATSTDELVQISGKPDVAKRALYEVSTLLHQNPRKDDPPLSQPMHFGGRGFHPSGPPPPMVAPRSPMWSRRNFSSHGLPPPMPWMGRFGNQPSEFRPDGFHGPPPRHGNEASAEFSMKILCTDGKIGGVIGKAGFNVRQLQQETGASIHVEEASTESDERAIRVSAFEALWNRRSQTIEAILQLQNKTSEYSEKGTITTRLLVASSKVGCILGQGGHVINEMRRRTQADIRVYSKEDKPKCAAEDEELVQIAGSFGVAKDALAEIASRLRVRTLRDANSGSEPALGGPAHGYGPSGNLAGGGTPQSSTMRAGSSGGYDPLKVDRHDFEPPNYPALTAPNSYSTLDNALESKIPNNALGSLIGGVNIPNLSECRNSLFAVSKAANDSVDGTRMKFKESQYSERDYVLENHGGAHDHLILSQSLQSLHQASMTAASQSMDHLQQGSYQSLNAQQSQFHNMMNPRQSPYQLNPQQSPYQMNSQQHPYEMNGTPQEGSYADINASQGAYQNVSTRKGAYQY